MHVRLQLPKEAQLEAKVGSKLELGDSFYTSVKTEQSAINVAQVLQINNNDLFHHLTKIIGDTVAKGEVIATKKGVLRTKKVHADRAGTVAQIDHNTGAVIIETTQAQSVSIAKNMHAFFSGKIINFDNTDKIATIEIEKAEEIPLKSVSSDGGGELYYFLDEGQYFTAAEDQIFSRVIVLSDLKPHIVAKCDALGSVGYVYLTGREGLDVNGAQVAKISDFESLAKHRKKYILYSMLDKKALIYE